MITDISKLDFSKTYTYADYLLWQFQERLELIKGRIFKMSPAPNSYHQSLSGDLYGEFKTFLKNKKCKVFYAPFDVRLPHKSKDDKDIISVVQPDLVIICNPEIIDKRGCLGTPDLIVEILSPSSSSKDIKEKYQLYEESGVKEYWIVHPTEAILEVFKLNEGGKYCLDKMYVRTDTVKVGLFDDFFIDLKEIFTQEISDYE